MTIAIQPGWWGMMALVSANCSALKLTQGRSLPYHPAESLQLRFHHRDAFFFNAANPILIGCAIHNDRVDQPEVTNNKG